MASRMVSVTANPTLYWTERPRLPLVFAVFIVVIQSSSSWEYPAPSTRINRLLRCGAGICAIASLNTPVWSAAVFEPAFPGRNVAASSSPVLSHQTPIG